MEAPCETVRQVDSPTRSKVALKVGGTLSDEEFENLVMLVEGIYAHEAD